MFKCKAVDEGFFETANTKAINQVDLNATPDEVFALLKSEQAWMEWFHGMHRVTWTSPQPYGEGTTRQISLGLLTVCEHYFIWEENKRFAFYCTKTNLPFVKALAEDYLLEATDSSTTRFTYTAAYDLALPLALCGPIGRMIVNRVLKNAALSLQRYVNSGRYRAQLTPS